MITGKILKHNGWPDGRIIGLAKKAAEQLTGEGLERAVILARLDAVRTTPGDYLSDVTLSDLARECLRTRDSRAFAPQPDRLDDALRPEAVPYRIWGREHIEQGALAQMDAAMRLPITTAGALMPDAHQVTACRSAACWRPKGR